MAISTYKTFLMMKKTTNGGEYGKLVDIKDFPDLGGAPEMLETTTLSDAAQTYIPGIESQEALTFTANYTKTDYDALKALAGSVHEFSVWFGASVSNGVVTPTGADGKFDFSGTLSVFVAGGATNEVVNMTISIAPSTVITVPAAST